jgi:hypothetical protein
MSAGVAALEARFAERDLPRFSLLVVSENATFITQLRERLGPAGIRVVGCLGPTHAPCPLRAGRPCPLAPYARIVLVDSPSSGCFRNHWDEMQVGVYAELLQKRHPDSLVIVCGAPEGAAGPMGDVAQIARRDSVVPIMRLLSKTYPLGKHLMRITTKRRKT